MHTERVGLGLGYAQHHRTGNKYAAVDKYIYVPVKSP